MQLTLRSGERCVAGLDSQSDSAGYVGSPAALGIGIAAGALCNFSTRLKVWLRVDDALDIVAVSLALPRALLTSRPISLAASSAASSQASSQTNEWLRSTAAMRCTSLHRLTRSRRSAGGAINGNWIQIVKQLAYSGAVIGYSFVVSSLILLLLDLIRALASRRGIDRAAGITLRVSINAEEAGIDVTQMVRWR